MYITGLRYREPYGEDPAFPLKKQYKTLFDMFLPSAYLIKKCLRLKYSYYASTVDTIPIKNRQQKAQNIYNFKLFLK